MTTHNHDFTSNIDALTDKQRFLDALYAADITVPMPLFDAHGQPLPDQSIENCRTIRALTDRGVAFLCVSQRDVQRDDWKAAHVRPTAAQFKDGTLTMFWALDALYSVDAVKDIASVFEIDVAADLFPVPGDGWDLVHCDFDTSTTVDQLRRKYVASAASADVTIYRAGEHYGDALVLRDYDEREYQQAFTVSLVRSSHDKVCKPQTMPLRNFFRTLATHKEGRKEGPAVIYADMVKGPRKNTGVLSVSAIVLDIDVPTPTETVRKALTEFPFMSFHYSTHSFGADRSEISKSALLSLMGDEDYRTDEAVQRYLREKKGYPDTFVKTATFVGERRTSEGFVIAVAHAPVEKHRVVVPIEVPFDMEKEGKTPHEAIQRWKTVPALLAAKLNLPYDPAATDCARLFYAPRHDEGQPFVASIAGGPLFDWRTLTDESGDALDGLAKKLGGGESKSRTEQGKRLGKWWKQYGHRFQVIAALEGHADLLLKGHSNGGHILTCPFDHLHSEPGKRDDTGCWAVDAGTGHYEYFAIKCKHTACHDYTSLDHLGQLIKQGALPESVLTDEQFMADVEGHEVSKPVARVTGMGTENKPPRKKTGFRNVPLPPDVTFDNETGAIHKTFANCYHLLEAQPWGFAYDELLTNYVFRADTLPWTVNIGHELNDETVREIRLFFIQNYDVTFSTDNILNACYTLGRRNHFNPVLDYLDSLRWDGTKRVETWLSDYLGAENTKLTREVGRLWLVAAVRRAREPGCKFDTALILEGLQGGGKSSVFGILGGEWFSDAPLGDVEDKDAAMQLMGSWLVEMGELAALNKQSNEAMKAFISRFKDKFRAPFDKAPKTHLRRNVFCGTVNGSAYLLDTTGNRRYWPVKVGDKLDLEALVRDRDQLWAEAAKLEASGMSIVLAQELWAVAGEEQAARVVDDPWGEPLREYLEGLKEDRVSTQDLLFKALDIPLSAQTQPMMKRLRAVMATMSGWSYKSSLRITRTTIDGKKKDAVVKGYQRAVPTIDA